MTDGRLQEAHKHSSHHRGDVEKSQLCGCFCCLSTFPPEEIRAWIDNDETALCPRCGVDSVIGNAAGFPLDEEFLGEMERVWFDSRGQEHVEESPV